MSLTFFGLYPTKLKKQPLNFKQSKKKKKNEPSCKYPTGCKNGKLNGYG